MAALGNELLLETVCLQTNKTDIAFCYMNKVPPGFIDSLPEKKEFRDRIPMQRYGKTDEISETVAFLASDGAGYITGQDIRVDGGITCSV